MKLHTPTYADVAATVALALALTTGGAYAAGKITGKQIAKNAITSSKIKNGTIQPVDLGSAAKTTLTGAPGATGSQGPRGFSAWDTIPSGTTVTGRLYDSGAEGAANVWKYFTVNLPATAPSVFTAENFAPDGSSATTDDDATCTGSYLHPTAPAGKVCVYAGAVFGLTNGDVETFAAPEHQKNVFYVAFLTGTAGAQWGYWASWAYTAP